MFRQILNGIILILGNCFFPSAVAFWAFDTIWTAQRENTSLGLAGAGIGAVGFFALIAMVLFFIISLVFIIIAKIRHIDLRLNEILIHRGQKIKNTLRIIIYVAILVYLVCVVYTVIVNPGDDLGGLGGWGVLISIPFNTMALFILIFNATKKRNRSNNGS
jgi:uncharacterized Tic20 family protein